MSKEKIPWGPICCPYCQREHSGTRLYWTEAYLKIPCECGQTFSIRFQDERPKWAKE